MVFSTLIDYFTKLFGFFRSYFQICISRSNNRKTFLEKAAPKTWQDERRVERIFCLGIYMSVSEPWICFWRKFISIKWRNKLLIHNIKLTGHRNSACCLRLLVFQEIWIIGSLSHRNSQNFPKGCRYHDLKAFCETGFNSVLLNIIENMK